jgi:allantoinase
VNVCSTNPAKRFGLYPRKGTIALGSFADLTLIDLHASFILQKEDLYYHQQHSPFVGKSFRGKVVKTILRGKTVYENGHFTEKAKGQMVI